jgi:hypothetical protein
MRCPKCKTATPTEALSCPGCKLKTPRGRLQEEAEPESALAQRVQEIFASHKPTMTHIPIWLSWSLILATLGVCVLGSYLSFNYFNDAQPASPPRHQEALDKLKAKTSNQPWMTVEESLNHEVEKCRQAGRLKEAEGWDARPAESGEVMVTFTFEENAKKRKAVWLVDPWADTYIPQNEMAEFIFKP